MNPVLSQYFFYYPITALRGEFVGKYLRKYENTQWLSPGQIANYHTAQLTKLLQHTNNSTPYYKQLFIENNISVNDIQALNNKQESLLKENITLLKSEKTLAAQYCAILFNYFTFEILIFFTFTFKLLYK